MPACTVEGCAKPTRSGRSPLCKMHYHRWYRHGRVDMTARETDVTASLGRRYKRVYAPGHPLADKGGIVYVHRQTLYSGIGPGPHPCHWCGTAVDWLPKGAAHRLQVDHINGDGADNRPENLVPSCGRCNTARAAKARSNALRAEGWWAAHDTTARAAGA